MTCPILERLAEYHADALDAAGRERVAGHLAECEACRRELAAMDAVVRSVEALPAPKLPDDLWQDVAARLETRPRPLWGLRRALVGAAILAVLTVGSLMTYRSSQPLPVASAAASPFVTRHEFLAAQDPLTDRASLGVMLMAQEGGR